MGKVVIAGWARTPFGSFLGSLSDIPAVKLGALAIDGTLSHAGLKGSMVDYVLMGMVIQAGSGQIPSRQATLQAGLPDDIPSDTINKVCASGMRAVSMAEMMIRCGEAHVIVAGGMENMSAAPHLLENARKGKRMGNSSMPDSMIKDGLWCPVYDVHMGVHGSKVPASCGVTREEADRWALRSHQRAINAIDNEYFAEEIVPVEIMKKKESSFLSNDELPRRDTSYEKMASLPPVFEKDGSVTAGNAPPISDGAGSLLIMSEERAEQLGVPTQAEIISHGVASDDPCRIATVPEAAGRDALQKAGMDIQDIDLIEVNEAFASVARTCIRLGDWNEELVNVNGGAVAMGHPIGASGARILMTLLVELKRRGGKYGMATICSGAAQGEAIIVKNLSN